MNEYALQQPSQHKTRSTIGKIMIAGLLLRITMLIIIMIFNADGLDPYFISDDIRYEQVASRFLLHGNGPFDFAFLKKVTKGYLQPFWPTVLCISASLFKTIYAGRYLNVIISTLCIKVVYNITLVLTEKERSALFAGRLFAFLPIAITTCCFPIKDIFLTLAVMYAFYIFLLFHNQKRVTIFQLVLCITGLVCIYFTRGAVVELMGMFFAAYLLIGLIKKKRYGRAVLFALLGGVVFILLKNKIMEAFLTKVDDYSGYNQESTGLLSYLQMKNPWEFYKIPFAYLFATLQPMTLNLFGAEGVNPWWRLMHVSNITIYPVAIANALYIFQKKHCAVFWWSGVIIYCAIVSMVLGIFRHYLFLIPLEMINCALYYDRTEGRKNGILYLGSFGIFLAVLVYSFINLN